MFVRIVGHVGSLPPVMPVVIAVHLNPIPAGTVGQQSVPTTTPPWLACHGLS